MPTKGDYVIREVPLSELHASTYQPKGRTDSSGSMNRLKASIRDIGLQYPPLVTPRREGGGYDMVDGHRRWTACAALAWPKIPVLVSIGIPGELFSAVTGTTKRMSAADWVAVYLSGGTPPSGATRTQINRLEAVMGRGFLEKLADEGLSPTIWGVANRMVRYTRLDTARLPAVLDWLLQHRLSRQVSAWISGEDSADELRLAFEQGRLPSLRGNGHDEQISLHLA